MLTAILLLLSVGYMAAAYLPLHQLVFIQQYQLLVNINDVLSRLTFITLGLIMLGAVFLFIIQKLVKPQFSYQQTVTIATYAVIVGVAASTITLALSSFYTYGIGNLIGKPDPWTTIELNRIAIHEAGHAVMREIELPGSTVKAEIINTTDISKVHGWFGQSLPSGFVVGQSSSRLLTKEDIYKSIRIYLAGLAAEEVMCSDGQQYISASDDLNTVKELVIKLCNNGLSPVGPVAWDTLTEEEQAHLYQQVVIPEYQTVLKTLEQQRPVLNAITKQLEDQRILTGEQIRKILNAE
ncbi:hypothetical protein V6C27_08200 [Peptococcaceae bacterium 1198_IL3148]